MTAALIARTRSFLNGQSTEAFGSGRTYPLSKQMTQDIILHISELAKVDMTAYRFERRHSDFRSAKSDIVIYDERGEVIVNGREFSDGRSAFWSSARSDGVRERAADSKKAWGSLHAQWDR